LPKNGPRSDWVCAGITIEKFQTRLQYNNKLTKIFTWVTKIFPVNLLCGYPVEIAYATTGAVCVGDIMIIAGFCGISQTGAHSHIHLHTHTKNRLKWTARLVLSIKTMFVSRANTLSLCVCVGVSYAACVYKYNMSLSRNPVRRKIAFKRIFFMVSRIFAELPF
jgi:hypothetical protein